MFKTTERNFDNIQFTELRKGVDGKFNNLHDELSTCYYNYWKHGESKPFISGDKTYDVQDDPEKSKELFDKLHGLIFYLRDIALDNENEKQSQPDEKLKKQFHEISEGETRKPIDEIKAKIAQLKIEDIKLVI